MKEIKAVIRPSKLEKLREALTELPDFPGMTVTRVEGCSPAESTGVQRPSLHEQLADFSAKVRIEIVAPDELAATLVQLIEGIAHTGQRGDGIVWVTGVEKFGRLKEIPPLPG